MSRPNNDRKRSSVIVFDSKAETEEFIRPDHNDFATSSELKRRQFTGLRNNSLTGSYELWVAGDVRETISLAAIAADRLALSDAYARAFGLPMQSRLIL